MAAIGTLMNFMYVSDEKGTVIAGVPASPEHVSAFQSSSDSGMGDDPFAVALQMSDSDREHDAWIPSETTKNILVAMATQTPGSYNVDKDMLCRPSLVITEPQVITISENSFFPV